MRGRVGFLASRFPDIRSRGCRAALLVLLLVVGATALAGIGYARSRRTSADTVTRVATRLEISVGRRAIGRPIPVGFLGLSIEYWAVEAYAGKNPAAINPALVQLVRNLSDAHTMVLRIGGASTDKTWWPVSHSRRPQGVNYSLDKRRLAVLRALADATDARMIMGINLEADSKRLAAAEARAMFAGIGRSRISALELGNEPELYASRAFPYYVKDGRDFGGRPASYDMAAFTRDFSRIGAALPPAPLAGPTSGGTEWLGQLGAFAAEEPRLRLVTVHRYLLQACYISRASPIYPTIGRLLSPVSSRSLSPTVLCRILRWRIVSTSRSASTR